MVFLFCVERFNVFEAIGSERLDAVSGIDMVNIYAAEREDGALTLMIVNLSLDLQEVPLTLVGEAGELREAWRLDPSVTGDEIALPDLAAPLTLPGQSVTLLVFAPDGE